VSKEERKRSSNAHLSEGMLNEMSWRNLRRIPAHSSEEGWVGKRKVSRERREKAAKRRVGSEGREVKQIG